MFTKLFKALKREQATPVAVPTPTPLQQFEFPLGKTFAYKLPESEPEFRGPTASIQPVESHLCGYRILKEERVTPVDEKRIVAALQEVIAENRRNSGVRGFLPRLGFRFYSDQDQAIEVLICNECHWVSIREGSRLLHLNPTFSAEDLFKEFYGLHFILD